MKQAFISDSPDGMKEGSVAIVNNDLAEVGVGYIDVVFRIDRHAAGHVQTAGCTRSDAKRLVPIQDVNGLGGGVGDDGPASGVDGYIVGREQSPFSAVSQRNNVIAQPSEKMTPSHADFCVIRRLVIFDYPFLRMKIDETRHFTRPHARPAGRIGPECTQPVHAVRTGRSRSGPEDTIRKVGAHIDGRIANSGVTSSGRALRRNVWLKVLSLAKTNSKNECKYLGEAVGETAN